MTRPATGGPHPRPEKATRASCVATLAVSGRTWRLDVWRVRDVLREGHEAERIKRLEGEIRVGRDSGGARARAAREKGTLAVLQNQSNAPALPTMPALPAARAESEHSSESCRLRRGELRLVLRRPLSSDAAGGTLASSNPRSPLTLALADAAAGLGTRRRPSRGPAMRPARGRRAAGVGGDPVAHLD